jgi:hypothetical protein
MRAGSPKALRIFFLFQSSSEALLALILRKEYAEVFFFFAFVLHLSRCFFIFILGGVVSLGIQPREGVCYVCFWGRILTTEIPLLRSHHNAQNMHHGVD